MSTILRFIGPAADYLASVEAHWADLGLGTPPLVAASLTTGGTQKYAESRKDGQRVFLVELLTGAGEPIINIEIHGGDEKLTADRLSPPLASAETVAHRATRGVLMLPVKDGIAAVRPKTPSFTISGAHDPWPAAEEPDAPLPPDWVQPKSAHDAYGVGAIVQRGESRWVSITPANMWEPGVSGWREVVEAGQISQRVGSDAVVTLPAPEAAGEPAGYGVQVATAADGRLTLLDRPLAAGARDDALGRELHGELILALDRLIAAAGRSNVVAEWREVAEAVKERIGGGPTEVRVSAILRFERLRSLREADERRRLAPDPLVEPAEAGVAAALRDAVAAANLYVDTDPYLAEQQRRLADPGVEPVLSVEDAAAAEVDLEALAIAEDALLAELRHGRETAAAGGEAGRRALVWLAGSWRNVLVEVLRRVLAGVREQVRAARVAAGDAAMQAKLGAVITLGEAAAVLEALGLQAKLAAAAVGGAAMASAARIWLGAEPEIGKAVGHSVKWGAVLLLARHLDLLPKLGWSPDFAAQIQRLLTGMAG